jgi:hypothetical protein
VVRPDRFELPTFWFVARRSIQLSYGRLTEANDSFTLPNTAGFAQPYFCAGRCRPPPPPQPAYDQNMVLRWFVFAAALLVLPAVTVAAGDAPIDRATLRGVKAVNIVLDQIDPELQKDGLTAADLEARLDARLQDGHMNVDRNATEFVGLRITAARQNRGPLAVSFAIGLYQPVTLVRDKTIKTATATWEVEGIVLAPPKVLRQASMETIDDLAARLVKAWRSVNPE